MKVADVVELGFEFRGASDDLWVVYPASVIDTLESIKEAKKFMKDSGHLWVDLMLKAKSGKQEIIRLHKEQAKLEIV